MGLRCDMETDGYWHTYSLNLGAAGSPWTVSLLPL